MQENLGATSYSTIPPTKSVGQYLPSGTFTTTWAYGTPGSTTTITFNGNSNLATPVNWVLDFNVTYNSGCTIAVP